MTTRYYNIYNRTIYDLLRNQSAGQTVEVNDKNYDEETRRIVAEQQQLFEERIKIEAEKQRENINKIEIENKVLNDEKEALLQKLKEDEKYYTTRAENFLKLGKYYGYMQGNLPLISRDFSRQTANREDSINKALQVLRANGDEAIIENSEELLIPLHKETTDENIDRLLEIQKLIKEENELSSLLEKKIYNEEEINKLEEAFRRIDTNLQNLIKERDSFKTTQSEVDKYNELTKSVRSHTNQGHTTTLHQARTVLDNFNKKHPNVEKYIEKAQQVKLIEEDLKIAKDKLDLTKGKIIGKINNEIKKSNNLEGTLLGGIQVGQNARFYPPFGYAKSLNPNTFTNEELYKTLSSKASVLLNQYKKK